ncbi:MAG: hypothetical protein IID45_06495 [Planctomycetes bacterium]|nr:hypothetical protein [Planctomycetota bacterium]
MGESAMKTKTENNKDVGEQFVRAVVPLLKEYTEKLEQIVQQADSIHKSLSKTSHWEEYQIRRARRQLQGMKKRASRLSPPVNDLNRRVSQMIANGRLDSELDRLELKLRLAELENAMDAAKDIDINLPSE